MNELESLRAQLNQIVDKIIAAAKNQSTTVPALTGTLITPQDLSTSLNNTLSGFVQTSTSKNLISGYAEPLKWTRNTNCWAKSINFTGSAVCVYGIGGVGGGTLITRKHVLFANHVPYPAIPCTVYFVDNANNTYAYKVVKITRIGTSDIAIGELDRDVDSAIAVYSILPNTFKSYFDSLLDFPVVFSDQEKKALIGRVTSLVTENGTLYVEVTINSKPNFAPFFEPVIVGDSGNPIFAIINNRVVLIGGWYRTWYANSALCTFLGDSVDAINTVVAPYKVEIADLSGFKRY